MKLSDDNVKSTLDDIPIGSYIRCLDDDDGDGHSLIIADKTDEEVTVYHCNYVVERDKEKYKGIDRHCLITYEKLSYARFAQAFHRVNWYYSSFETEN